MAGRKKEIEGNILEFILNSKTVLTNLCGETIDAVKQRLTMPNQKFAEAEKMNRSTRGIDRELMFYEVCADGFICPRGCATKIYHLCDRTG